MDRGSLHPQYSLFFYFRHMKGRTRLIMGSRPSHHACGPPSRDTISSTVMIVTSSLPFQLDAQFHSWVPRESQPHHPRLESRNCQPLHTCSWTLLSLSIQFCLFNLMEEHVIEQRTMSVHMLPDNTHMPYTEKCLDNRALQWEASRKAESQCGIGDLKEFHVKEEQHNIENLKR